MLPTVRLACAALLASAVLFVPASARQWSPDARAQALDYTQILHTKPNGEFVFLWWAVPEAFPESAPNAPILQSVLSRYIVIGIAHGRPGTGGAPNFVNIQDLTIADQTSRALSPLAMNALPAEAAQTIASMQALARQSLGPVGQGIRWFVFDGSTVRSCAPGRMSVPYAGETYSFDTPIPGCAR